MTQNQNQSRSAGQYQYIFEPLAIGEIYLVGFGRLFQGKDMCCTLKPSVCWEKKFELKSAEERKHIMVIGGAIAGMAAARVSALRGHTITFVERSGELSGVFIPASNMRFKKEDKELILDIPGV